jgi:hypothetical protein
LNVGKLEKIRKEDFKMLCDRIEQKVRGLNTLFLNIPEEVEKEAELLYRRILKENLLDCKIEVVAPEKKSNREYSEVRTVDLNSISSEDSRTFGGEWLSKQMLDQSGLHDFLTKKTDNEKMLKLIETAIISRMVHPSSELETSRWLESESSLNEILTLHKTPAHRKLYDAARKLYSHKDEIEKFLYQHFESSYPDKLHLCLYDLTNFYFEGRKAKSQRAQFGRSKEKRSDAKLISLALLSNGQGFICHSKFYKGNISEPSTLQDIISDMEIISKDTVNMYASKPVAVMDAGIATENNLKSLREKGFDYICVSRSGLKCYSIEDSTFKTVFDNRKQPIKISIVHSKDNSDNDLYLCVESSMKQIKEQSMSDKLTQRFVSEIENIKNSLTKKRGVKKEGGVNQRIGRLKQKYPSISKLYSIDIKADKTGIVSDILV